MQTTFQKVRSKGKATIYQEVGGNISRRMLSLDNDVMIAKNMASYSTELGLQAPDKIRVTIESA